MKEIIGIVVLLGLLSCGGGETATEETTQDLVEEVIEAKEFDAADFIDNTENYKDEVFEWKFFIAHSIHSPKSLKDFKGQDVEFVRRTYSEPIFPEATRIHINIPATIKVPKVDFLDAVIVKFKCGGDLNAGNVALSVSRP